MPDTAVEAIDLTKTFQRGTTAVAALDKVAVTVRRGAWFAPCSRSGLPIMCQISLIAV